MKKCVICGEPLTKTRLYCPTHGAQEHQRKVWAGNNMLARTCENCGAAFTGGRRTKFCPTCLPRRDDGRPADTSLIKKLNLGINERRRDAAIVESLKVLVCPTLQALMGEYIRAGAREDWHEVKRLRVIIHAHRDECAECTAERLEDTPAERTNYRTTRPEFYWEWRPR